ncbi:hypothetical protein QCN27_12735 [Cereibacter sp. SYSU M97828]|nr:hypothetical protein [Cereibacter flavus]
MNHIAELSADQIDSVSGGALDGIRPLPLPPVALPFPLPRLPQPLPIPRPRLPLV